MRKGWIVEASYSEHDGMWLQRFDVAISDPEEAIAAVRIRVGHDTAESIRIVEELFDATYYGLGLVPGEISPRVRYRR